MRKITWLEAIEIAKRRNFFEALGPLYVLCNGGADDFASLQGTGIVGAVANDGEKWFVDTGSAHVYLVDSETVWVG